MELTTPNILSLIVPTGIISALLTHGMGWLKDWIMARAERKRAANSAALKLAICLEGYAFACANLVVEIELGKKKEAESEWGIPEMPPYPEVNWEVLSSTHTSLVMSFPNEIRTNNLFTKTQKDVGGLKGGENDPYIQSLVSGSNGYKAIVLAERLREDHNLLPLNGFDKMSSIQMMLEASHTEYVTRVLKANGIDDPGAVGLGKILI